MPPDIPLEVDFCIICDDIRQEVSGKFLLIGVYTNDITVSAGHPALNVAAAINLKAKAAGSYSFRVRGRFEGATIAEIEARSVYAEPSTTFGSLEMQLLGLRRSGMLSIEVKLAPDRDWEEVRALPVIVRSAGETGAA